MPGNNNHASKGFLGNWQRYPDSAWLAGGGVYLLAVLASLAAKQLSGHVLTLFLPFFSILALVALSIRIGPWAVFIWGIFYALGFLVAVTQVVGSQADALSFVRAATIFVGGGLATRIAFLRERAALESTHLSNALLQLPLGVILSDHEGTIRFVNEEACRRLGLRPEDLVGRSFFSIFAVPEAQGDFKVDYQILITAPSNQPSRVILSPRDSSNPSLNATITPLRVSNRTVLLTCFANSREESGPKISPSP